MVPTLCLFDRFDNRLGILSVSGAMTHTEELGGEDTLEFGCYAAPEKGDRLLWSDPEDGAWREHVVVRTEEPLRGPARVYAESSLCELLGDFIEEVQLVGKTAEQAMAAALAPTRWALGDVGVGEAKRGCLLYHVNALAAVRRVEEVWGGEAEAGLTVSGGRVASRTLSLPARRGAWRGARVTYGKGLAACTRTVLEDEVFTALYGYGKGLPVYDEAGHATGGFTRRLTFGSLNGGVNWIGDEAARLAWGRWDAARGTKVHRYGSVVFPDCEDASELLALTRAELARVSAPQVSYEVDAAEVLGCGHVGLGDDVAVCDDSRAPGSRVRARCVRRVRTFGESTLGRRLTLGRAERSAWAAASEVSARVAGVEETAAVAADTVGSLEDLGSRRF